MPSPFRHKSSPRRNSQHLHSLIRVHRITAGLDQIGRVSSAPERMRRADVLSVKPGTCCLPAISLSPACDRPARVLDSRAPICSPLNAYGCDEVEPFNPKRAANVARGVAEIHAFSGDGCPVFPGQVPVEDWGQFRRIACVVVEGLRERHEKRSLQRVSADTRPRADTCITPGLFRPVGRTRIRACAACGKRTSAPID